MSLRINNNVPALRAHSDLVGITGKLNQSVERISSGLRINRAADDAAGLTISEKLRRQVRGLQRATMNTQDGISMIQSAEGSLNETHSILHRMRELAIQSSNDTLTSKDRLEIQKEVNQLRDDLNRIAFNTEFNTKRLLDGSQSAVISTSSHAARGLVTGDTSTGGDYSVSISLLRGGMAQLQRTQIFTLRDATSKLATGDTLLVSIAQFYDANGVFVLDEPQALAVNGNTRTTEAVLDAQMTLDNLASTIQAAILGSESGLEMENSYARVVQTTQTMAYGLGGYVEVMSGTIGEEGRISFAGDQTLIDSLGFEVERAAKDNFVEVNLTTEDGTVRTIQTETDRAVGLLNGIDIQFDSQPAQIAGVKGIEQGLKLTAVDSFSISAGGGMMHFTIGTGYWTLEGIARSINAQAEYTSVNTVGTLKGLTATVVEDEIRLEYNRPASVSNTVGNGITIFNATNSTTLGFNNGFYSGFADGRKREDALAWGFSKVVPGIASGETTAIEIGDGQTTMVLNVLTALGTAPGSVSNADMVDIESFKATVNDRLMQATVAVRMDFHDGALAFTSTRVGSDNVAPSTEYSSVVTVKAVTVTGSLVSATESMLRYFGISSGSRSGSGDTNFRIHVQGNEPQFHIGANQAEVMKISMSDMSARALGVDNLDMTSFEGAQRAIGRLNKAIDKVSSERSKLGAYQNRLEYTMSNLRQMRVNAMASESRIRDADIAAEMIDFTSRQVMQQSANAMVAQANSQAKGILQLLQ